MVMGRGLRLSSSSAASMGLNLVKFSETHFCLCQLSSAQFIVSAVCEWVLAVAMVMPYNQQGALPLGSLLCKTMKMVKELEGFDWT